MRNLYSKIGLTICSAAILMCTGCKDDDNTAPETGGSGNGGGSNAIEMTLASAYYDSTATGGGIQPYTLYLSNGIATESNGNFSGAGKGICFEMGAPSEDPTVLPAGTYELGNADSFYFIPGDGTKGSFYYAGPSAERADITGGSITVEREGTAYKIAGNIACDDGQAYDFSYAGPLVVKAAVPEEPEEPEDPEKPEPVKVELTKSGGIYLGTLMNDSYDNFSIYFTTDGVSQENLSFSGVGKGIYLDIYVPVAGKTSIPTGDYTMSAEAGERVFLPGEDLGGSVMGSFVYSLEEGGDEALRYIPITDGTVKVTKQTYLYTVQADVTDSNGVTYQFTYTGPVFSILDPMGSVTYTDMPKSGGYYLGTMMNPDFDNYSYYITSENVTESNMSFGGTGIGIMFDMYAPLNTGVTPAVGTYTIYEEKTDESRAFKFLPGVDLGSAMTGTFIWMRDNAADEPIYICVVGGTMDITEADGTYTVKAHLFGNEGEEYNYQFSGNSLNVIDPMAP